MHFRRCKKIAAYTLCCCGRVQPCTKEDCRKYVAQRWFHIRPKLSAKQLERLEMKQEGWSFHQTLTAIDLLMADGLTLEESVSIVREIAVARLST